MSLELYDKLKRNKAEINTKQNYNTTRPAQAISFGGSAISMGEKFVQGKIPNKLIDVVWRNEAAFTAIYSLVLAGIIKPMLVLNSKGSEEKDKQIIATKNFLQAFIGSFLNLTIGGGIIKKAVDYIKNDLKLIDISKQVDGNPVIDVVSKDHPNALEIARKSLIKERTGFSAKFNEAVKSAKTKEGLAKAGTFIKGLFTKLEYEPKDGEILNKAGHIVKDFAKNRLKFFKKDGSYVEQIVKEKLPPVSYFPGSTTTFYDAFESFWKNSTGWLTAIMKAKISSALLPGVMAAIFAKKIIDKNNEKSENFKGVTPLTANSIFKKENEEFKLALSKKSTPINFKGKLTDKMAKGLASGVEWLSMTKVGKAPITGWLVKCKKPSPRMADLESILLTGYWLQNTTRSKKIEPDQKLGLNIQTTLVTVVSSLLALGIDKVFDKPMDKAETAFKEVLSNDIKPILEDVKQGKVIENLKETIQESCKNLAGSEEIAKKLSKTITSEGDIGKAIDELGKSYYKKLGKMKSLTIFTLVVRLLVPVLMVPVAGKIKKYFKEYKAKKEEENKANKVD